MQIITLQPKIPVSEIEDVKRTLRDYTDRVTKGEIDFSTLARLYSEDKASAIKGGECGFMGRGMMDPAYANVAFSLQDPKKVSKIVESEFGFHIIQLIEKRGDRVNTRHILLRPKVSEKELTEACARLDSIADDIRANKFTFDDAAAVISQDKDTRNNHGIMVNINEHSGITTSKFQMQDLPQDVAKVVDKMNVGEISKAFTMINEKDGKELLRVASVDKVEKYILKEVQKVYRTQGVAISDKHVEIIIKQMLQKVVVIDEGDTDLLPGTFISKPEIYKVIKECYEAGRRLPVVKPVLLGITRASLKADSFLSAASFQETTRVLTEAAIRGKIDTLDGLKENIIIGGLIPAGTGLVSEDDVEIQEDVNAPQYDIKK